MASMQKMDLHLYRFPCFRRMHVDEKARRLIQPKAQGVSQWHEHVSKTRSLPSALFGQPVALVRARGVGGGVSRVRALDGGGGGDTYDVASPASSAMVKRWSTASWQSLLDLILDLLDWRPRRLGAGPGER